jgi:hypothetical protein
MWAIAHEYLCNLTDQERLSGVKSPGSTACSPIMSLMTASTCARVRAHVEGSDDALLTSRRETKCFEAMSGVHYSRCC